MKLKAIVCDVDGTVALRTERQPYDMSRVGEDICNDVVWAVIRALHITYGYPVVFTSGRDEKCRDDTGQWLNRHFRGLEFHLMMRTHGDGRPDSVVKKEMLDEILDVYDVFCVFDDRNSVVDMWRANGLTCLQVAPGDF